MGEVVAFRRKKLTGFLPEETAEECTPFIKSMKPPQVPFFDPYAPLDFGQPNPDSGDCA